MTLPSELIKGFMYFMIDCMDRLIMWHVSVICVLCYEGGPLLYHPLTVMIKSGALI